jgi:hypothetical protein
MLKRGADLNRYALDTMAGCLESQIWPSARCSPQWGRPPAVFPGGGVSFV